MPAPLLHRDLNTHKGDYGHVLVLAGSRRFVGAACLCAEAAIRSGAGRVTLGIPKSLHPIIASRIAHEIITLPLPETKTVSLHLSGLKEILSYLKSIESVVIGPGISVDDSTKKLVRSLIESVSLPMVVDADGIRAVAEKISVLNKSKAEIVLTPHPGEMAHLCGMTVGQVQAQRKNIAKKIALRYNITLILKGFRTIVASDKGKVYENLTGNPGMATAGTGDVLSGILGAFLALKLETFEAAC
ncbi:MAG TPA: NAD(P)H-hydrate dehydratase, partial [Candidatus Omnitrophota bacterium]|nr:NAD(P)H-hydrate dehydratase [Candidatus Omnitrophota bacterium]